MEDKKNIHPIIIDTIINWTIVSKKKLSYFGHFLSKMTFEEDNNIKTMLVKPNKSGFKLVYSSTFIDSITEPEVKYVLLHEIFHCFNFHLSRLKKYNMLIANYAMDMIVNNQVDQLFLNIKDFLKQPEGVIKLPMEYKGPIVFESIYEWLIEKKDEESYEYSDTEKIFEKIKNNYYFDDHLDSNDIDIDIEEIQHNLNTIHKNIENDLKGEIPGVLKSLIQSIKKRKENPVNFLKNLMSDAVNSNKRKTFRKLNRKGIPGFKGVIKNGMVFNCIADVSGSMENVLKDAIGVVTNSMYSMNLIKVDAKVQSYVTYNKASDLKNLEFVGGGGTILQPGIDFIKKNKTLNKNGTIIITDGFIDELDLSKLNDVIMVYTHIKPRIFKQSKKYKEFKIEV